jgi:hypothetical protein
MAAAMAITAAIPEAVRDGAVSPEEVVRRVAILKRFRELLKAQRDRFHQYLEVLDKQKDVIEQGSPDDLISHVELEEKILSDIYSIQRVIDPLEDMYRAAYSPRDAGTRVGISAGASAESGDAPAEVSTLKSALEGLKTEAALRSERNKVLLSHRMTEIRREIKNLRKNPYAGGRSVYGNTETSALIDIQG